MDNPQAMVAKTVLNVVLCGQKMSARQMLLNIPAEERLSDVEVLSVGVDPVDPSVMELSLKLNTFAGRSAMLSMLIGGAQAAMDKAGAGNLIA